MASEMNISTSSSYSKGLIKDMYREHSQVQIKACNSWNVNGIVSVKLYGTLYIVFVNIM